MPQIVVIKKLSVMVIEAFIGGNDATFLLEAIWLAS